MRPETDTRRYCVVLYDAPTNHEISMVVVATSVDEAMTMAERTGADYTDAQVRDGNYNGDVLAEYGANGDEN